MLFLHLGEAQQLVHIQLGGYLVPHFLQNSCSPRVGGTVDRILESLGDCLLLISNHQLSQQMPSSMVDP